MMDSEALVRPGVGRVESVQALLDAWVGAGWLRALDRSLACFLLDEVDGELPPLTMLAVALVSHQVGRGHVCLDLSGLVAGRADDVLALPPEAAGVSDGVPAPSSVLAGVSEADWQAALTAVPSVIGTGEGRTPLVLAANRLYLRRYWQYEQTIAAGIRSRLTPVEDLADPEGAAARALAATLGTLFHTPTDSLDWQRLACGLAARTLFSIITGGPGTGKTTTVLRLLAALQSVEQATTGAPGLRIRLAAPTGKAAARLGDSIVGKRDELREVGLPGGDALVDSLPDRVTTLHRLLGSRPGTRQFRHNRDHPLPLDVLVIDEASMVDVEMMACVFDALPPSARIILLGDKDQLASVDAGAVLGDLCRRADGAHYRADTAHWLAAVTGQAPGDEWLDQQGTELDQAVAMLRVSHRFGADSGIGALSQAVNGAGLDRGTAAPFRDGRWPDIAWHPVNASSIGATLSRHVLDGSPSLFGRPDTPSDAAGGYRSYLMRMAERPSAGDRETLDAWAANVLSDFDRFQVLCALRGGRFGVEGLNETIAGALQRAGLIERTHGWYAGRPVLVTRNDYNLGLMNGDIGVTLPVPWGRPDSPGDVLRVAFPSGDSPTGVRWVSPSRLQSVETVYAMTVHKSQGSEFHHTCLVVPDRRNPVLTRELLYTGITRASRWFSLMVPDERVLLEATGERVMRTSGLPSLVHD
ncbi:exodeoxyribonuclease V subunit alpha [Tamilnaduibacter salinus]|nr:exodeoxyribonuclease V subunit alpha [Tamilnaduibacter salinus]